IPDVGVDEVSMAQVVQGEDKFARVFGRTYALGPHGGEAVPALIPGIESPPHMNDNWTGARAGLMRPPVYRARQIE
ncbi:MAG: hypothetical protein ACOYKM_14320, partial [Caulobacterales bacterium]